MGVLWLSTVPLTSGIVVGQFGVANAGSLFGIVFLAHQIGAFIGVRYGGKLADSTGSYVAVWWIAVGLGLRRRDPLLHRRPPAPPAPVRVAGAGLGASAGMASIAVLAAVSAVGAANTTAARPTEQAAASATVPVCIVHPTS
ncbi:MAG: hypothetical protein R2755_33295 [Acidimicrobiales bacterium]